MMQLQDPAQTKVIIVTLAETTPVLEAAALQADLLRAGIAPWAWVINNSLAAADTTSPLLRQRAGHELHQIGQVRDRYAHRLALVPIEHEEPVGIDALLQAQRHRTRARLPHPGHRSSLGDPMVFPDDACPRAGPLCLSARCSRKGSHPAGTTTPRLLSTSASESSAPGTRVKYAQTPRLSRCSSPASTSTFRWWDTVGWVSPNGSVRSQTHASPPSWAAISDSSRNRAGSAMAFNVWARSVAASASSGSRTSGAQHATFTRGNPAAVMTPVCPAH